MLLSFVFQNLNLVSHTLSVILIVDFEYSIVTYIAVLNAFIMSGFIAEYWPEATIGLHVH